MLGARFARVLGGKAVRESFARSVRATCDLVTCVSYVRLARGPGVKFLACRLFSFSSASWTLYLFCLPVYREFCLFGYIFKYYLMGVCLRYPNHFFAQLVSSPLSVFRPALVRVGSLHPVDSYV